MRVTNYMLKKNSRNFSCNEHYSFDIQRLTGEAVCRAISYGNLILSNFKCLTQQSHFIRQICLHSRHRYDA